MSEPLVFDLDRIEESVTLKLKGEEQKYVLRELIGKERDEYLTSLFARMKTGNDGKSTLNNAMGLQASLVSKALTHANGSLQGSPVDIETINSWPARIVKSLFERAKEISGLDDEAEKKAKKDSEAKP